MIYSSLHFLFILSFTLIFVLILYLIFSDVKLVKTINEKDAKMVENNSVTDALITELEATKR